MITGIRTHIIIDGMEIIRTPYVRIDSKRHVPVSRARIVLPDPNGTYARDIDQGGSVEIRLGYRNAEPAVWKGVVSRKKPGITKDQVTIEAVGEELPLAASIITQSWKNETPEAIIRWAVGQAGLEIGRIDSPGVVFPHFAASSIPVWQVARQCAHTCQRAFGVDMNKWALWMDADGKINWGDFDESGDVPDIGTGDGLIKHTPDEGDHALNMVETFLIAGFRHSQLFRLTDTRRGIDDAFRALSVIHEIKERSVRTFIGYGEEHGGS